MATPMRVYRDIAHQYGNVDPSDTVAVRKFFRETLPTKPLRFRQQIMDTILAHDGEDEIVEPVPLPVKKSTRQRVTPLKTSRRRAHA
jgi:hypothetical protein